MLGTLAHVNTWIFDLDNTLYPASAGIFDLIDARMGAYIARLMDVDAGEAHRIQKKFFHEHGTTLSGLMAHHDTDRYEFLADVHNIDMSGLRPDPRLAAQLAALPGRKLIFTNGDAPYARRILAALGLADSFEAIFDIHDQDYVPKPAPQSYTAMCAALRVDPHRAIFFEDMARNLRAAKALGMMTVWINNGSEGGSRDADRAFIDFETPDLTGFLADILETRDERPASND